MLYLVVFFGDALDDRAGFWTWPFLLSVLAAVDSSAARFSPSREHRARANPTTAAPAFEGHRGMPALNGLTRKVAWAERIPPALFYLPIALSWIGFALRHRSLTLPTAVNPRIPTGGMWGKSKGNSLFDVAASERRWVADFIILRRSAGLQTVYADLERARAALDAAGLAFPLVAKPDMVAGLWRAPDRRRAGVARLPARLPERGKADPATVRPPCRGGGAALRTNAGGSERPHPLAGVPLLSARDRRRAFLPARADPQGRAGSAQGPPAPGP